MTHYLHIECRTGCYGYAVFNDKTCNITFIIRSYETTLPYSWTEHLTESELQELMSSSVVISYDKNEIIIKQGSMASQILTLEQGMVKLNYRESNKTLRLVLVPAETS